MKRIGLLGGMSAESTLLYYKTLIQLTNERLGGLHGPDMLIRSVDFAPIAAAQAQEDWSGLGKTLNKEARSLELAGADLLVLATNTMHKLADDMMQDVSIPLLHIADTTAAAITEAGYKRPALMATAFTMEQSFYIDRLTAQGLAPILPDAADRATTHRIIYDELCRGVITKDSRRTYVAIAERLKNHGADCLILGCTEVCLLLSDKNSPLPTFNTTALHCHAALDAALS